MTKAVRTIAWVGGIALVLVGIWAFGWPRNFFDNVGTFPPYNRHFIHDVGAFNFGLGATLLLALALPDALFAALGGNAAAQVLHFVAHVKDRDLGGRAIDPWSFAVIAVVLVVAALTRRREAGGGSGRAMVSKPGED